MRAVDAGDAGEGVQRGVDGEGSITSNAGNLC